MYAWLFESPSSLLLSLVQMAPTTINKNGSQWAKPGPKTSPSTDTAPPIGKYGRRQLNTISLSLASETLHKEARKGMTTTHITNFFSSVPNQRNTTTEMETDGIAILVSDSEPEVLDGNNSQ